MRRAAIAGRAHETRHEDPRRLDGGDSSNCGHGLKVLRGWTCDWRDRVDVLEMMTAADQPDEVTHVNRLRNVPFAGQRPDNHAMLISNSNPAGEALRRRGRRDRWTKPIGEHRDRDERCRQAQGDSHAVGIMTPVRLRAWVRSPARVLAKTLRPGGMIRRWRQRISPSLSCEALQRFRTSSTADTHSSKTSFPPPRYTATSS